MELTTAIILFIISTLVIGVAGTMLARTSDQLADVTGWGEALFGAIFLGGVTSLSGIITSVVAASHNYPQLAMSNAIGGIAAQTVFLSIADITYSKVNLEHAAASFTNIMQGLLLICLLSIVLIGITGPELSIFNIHPFSLLIIAFYLAGSKLITNAKDHPMWRPRITVDTMRDIPDKKNIQNLSLRRLIIQFIIQTLFVGAAGYAVTQTGIAISTKTGLSEVFVGTLFTAISTSLPELIVSVAAVRQNALTLAISNIIGGNTFDVLFVSFADVAYKKGSILHAISDSQIFIVTLSILMTSILILGLLHRQKQGIAKIGWESTLILLLYIAGNVFLFFTM
ncbi:MAG: sodium:calcium antiporter [Bacteroidetes bacterium]|jgi:cation:H+ antiporter|nr:sodium:calcium antiporter [Bacteroidota bacterium]